MGRKMIWLCLLAGLAGWLLSLAGIARPASGAAGGLGLSWALVCAALTEAWSRRSKLPPDLKQKKLENQLLLLAAILALLDQLVRLFPDSVGGPPAVFAGLCLYYIARVAGPKLRKKESFTMREILLIIACGVLACVLLIPLVDQIGVLVLTGSETAGA